MNNMIQEIKSKLSLEEVAKHYLPNLVPSSNSLKAPCPFHNETKPSFHIYPDHFYCYGCQKNGDLFDFVAAIEGWDFPTTLKFLAEKAGVDLSEHRGNFKEDSTKQLKHFLDIAQSYFSSSIEMAKNTAVGDYVNQRGLDEATIERFGIGFAPDSWDGLTQRLINQSLSIDDAVEVGIVGRSKSGKTYDQFRNRLMFPIHDFSGRIVGFGGRALSDGQDNKYINSKDSVLFKKGRILYGLFQARKAIQAKKAINLAEGYMDVLSLVKHGYENSVGYLGTAFTEDHAEQVARLTSYAYIIPDADPAGMKAALNICKLLLQRGVECWVVALPEGEDVDSILAQKDGKAQFDLALRAAAHGFGFITTQVDSLSIKDKSQWVSEFLNKAKSEYFAWIIPRLSGLLEISEFELRRMIKNAPGMFDEERKVLQFLHSYPAYVCTLQARGVEELFHSDEAKCQWEALLSGEAIEQTKLNLQGSDVMDYWYAEIKTILLEQMV